MAEHTSNTNSDDELKHDNNAHERSSSKEISAAIKAEHVASESSDKELMPTIGETEEANPGEKPKLGVKSKYSRKKIILVSSAAIVALLAVLFIVPLTRYAILGTIIKRDVTLTVQDSKTSKSVSEVDVSIAGQTVKTDAQGKVTIKSISVGDKTITAKKKFYQDLSVRVLVPVTGPSNYQFSVVATGRQVPVKVINKISTQPIEGAHISAAGTSSKTDKNGEAIIVLPADKSSEDAIITLDGYNKTSATIQITEQKDDKNTLTVVPSGKVYFLSKRTGKIDVMKSDLDGGNAQTVLAGTGKEEDANTVLLAARDWKYLALKSRRDSDNAKLYVIDTTNNDKLVTVDEGDATFKPIGWYNEYFAYTITRTKVENWQPKKFALKSFNAKTGQLATLDETDAVGTDSKSYAYEDIDNVYILNNLLLYTKRWFAGYSDSLLSGKRMHIMAVAPNGQDKRSLKEFDVMGKVISARLYKPQEIYFQVSDYNTAETTYAYYEFEDGSIKDTKLTSEDFNKFYPTFLLSPSGQKTFWYEPRDGKSTLFLGDANGDNSKEAASLSDFTPYGWYSDEYLLVSKKGSELYILSRTNPTASPVKLTDYHKPQVDFAGYGYGYGGF